MTDVLGPQYLGGVNGHGLGFSRDGKYINSVSTTSNSLTVIKTEDNSIVSTTWVDRASHEGFFSADNRTVWVACRATSNVDIVDGLAGGIIARVATAPGPSKVLFSPDGTTAYVNHIRSATLDIVDVQQRKVVDSISGLADIFSSDMQISASGETMWVAHKMVGMVSVVDLTQRKVVAILNTGPETNHPNFAIVNGTNYGFITVAALNQTKVYRQSSPSQTPVFVTAVQMSGIEAHGIWPSADNTRMYVVNEHSDTVDVIDTSTLKVIHTMNIGQEGQALVYVAGAVPTNKTGTQNLGRQGLDKQVKSRLITVSNEPSSTALLTVRGLSGLDMFQIIGRQLEINATYSASARPLSCSGCQIELVDFQATVVNNVTGCATAPQVLAFFKFFGVYDINSVTVQRL